MSDEATFLDALKANPADDTARLVYADWLDERGEPAKAEYLRLTCQLAAAGGYVAEASAPAERLLELGGAVADDWTEAAAGRFDLLLTGYEPRFKIQVIKTVRERFGLGLYEAKVLSEALPARLLGWVPLGSAVVFGRLMKDGGPMELSVRPSDPTGTPHPPRYAVVADFFIHNWDADEVIPEVVAAATGALVRLTADALGVSADEAGGLARNRPVHLARGLSVLAAGRLRARTKVGGPYDGFSITCSVVPDPAA